MTPTAYAIACIAAMVIFALLAANDRTRQQRDDALVANMRLEEQVDEWQREAVGYQRAFVQECEAHDTTASQRDYYQRAASDNLTSLCVVLDAHARDIVLDPLGSDLLPDESLRLVRGQQ